MVDVTWRERLIDTGTVKLRAIEQGEGPLVLMIHGFPGLAFSWRHQMAPLAQAGFKAVAIDSLGYGGSDRPVDQALYTADQMQHHLLSVLDAYGAQKALIVGQDFGAQYAWNLAVRSPERVAALVATIPYDYDLAGRALLGSQSQLAPEDSAPLLTSSPDRLPSERFAAMAAQHFVHFHYFQAVGEAEKELAPQVAEFLQRLFFALSGDGDLWQWRQIPSEGAGYLDALAAAPSLPWQWLSEQEFAYFVRSYDHPDPAKRLIGGLNSYRTADANWRQGQAWADANVDVPTAFIYGANDPSFAFFEDWEPRMRARVPGLQLIEGIPEAGHFVQQEQPDAFNASLIAFLENYRS